MNDRKYEDEETPADVGASTGADAHLQPLEKLMNEEHPTTHATVVDLSAFRRRCTAALAVQCAAVALRLAVLDAAAMAERHGANVDAAMARAAWLSSIVAHHHVAVHVHAWLRDDACPFIAEPDDWTPWHQAAELAIKEVG